MGVLEKTILSEAHTLIGGTTGSGKSSLIHSIIGETMKQPTSNVRLVLIDLKRVELIEWKNTKHCLTFINDPKQVCPCLIAYIQLMQTRYQKMEKLGLTQSPYTHIYIVIDELADVISTNPQAIQLIAKIGRLGRAANIHLIMATQSPDRKTICAIIQQNITCALALRCKTPIESRQILGMGGAEKLPRYGQGIIWNANGYQSINIPYFSKEDRIKARQEEAN